MFDISIAIPMYNEQENVYKIKKELIPVIKSLKMKTEILIINDGSTDNTLAEIKKLQKKYKMIKVISHITNKGIGAALDTAFRNVKGNYVITLDGDFSYHPSDISILLKKAFEDYDCVIGSPFLKKENIEENSFIRIFLSKGINTIYSILLKKKLSCYTGIFRCYKRTIIKNLKIESSDYVSITEILLKLIQKRAKIVEVSVKLYPREHGEPKIKFSREIKNHIKLINKIILWKVSD